MDSASSKSHKNDTKFVNIDSFWMALGDGSLQNGFRGSQNGDIEFQKFEFHHFLTFYTHFNQIMQKKKKKKKKKNPFQQKKQSHGITSRPTLSVTIVFIVCIQRFLCKYENNSILFLAYLTMFSARRNFRLIYAHCLKVGPYRGRA